MYLVFFLVLVVLVVAILSYQAASRLSAPSRAEISEPPDDIPFVETSFLSTTGSRIQGWFAKHPQPKGALLLLHGVRANRMQLLSRAQFLYQAGYSTLLFDFQAHGESEGERITYGYLESKDVEAAIEHVVGLQPDVPLGVIGVSLGGVAFTMSEQHPAVKAAVLEAVYQDFDSALDNRLAMRFGRFAPLIKPLLSVQVYPRLGFKAEELSPVSHISKHSAAILIIAGELDRHTTLPQSKALYEAANEPKAFWSLAGQGHVNFYTASPDQYREKILTFFEQHLARP